MQRGRLHLLVSPSAIIATAALIPILPLLLHGCSCGHDFDFHLLNWLEAARQFSHGNLHPHWAHAPAYNAGEPRFVFYPPLSWTIGAVLGLLFPWAWTPILYTWLTLTAAGLALHRLARTFASPTPALLGAIFYLVNPYMLFTAYERTAYAELLAAVWIPLLLHAILRPEGEGGVTVPRIALPVALLWLTNAPAAVMGCYALALLTLARLFAPPATPTLHPHAPAGAETQSRLSLAVHTITGTALGLGLAAFYVLPAAYERRYVQIAMAIIPGMRTQDNFLFGHTATGLTDPAALAEALAHDVVLHTASLIAVVLIALTALAICLTLRRSFSRSITVTRQALYPITTLAVAIALLLTPISAPIWNHAPELAFLQFPWRLLAILAAILSLTLALSFPTAHLRPALAAAAAFAIAATFSLPAYTLFHQSCAPEETVPGLTALFQSNSGYEPIDEYTPVTADNDSLTHTNPPFWLSPNSDAPAPPDLPPGPAPTSLDLNSPAPQNLILNLRDYPAWHIVADGKVVTDRARRDDGLIAIPVSAGPSHLSLTYAQLPDQTAGYITSGLSLAVLGFLIVQQRRATSVPGA